MQSLLANGVLKYRSRVTYSPWKGGVSELATSLFDTPVAAVEAMATMLHVANITVGAPGVSTARAQMHVSITRQHG